MSVFCKLFGHTWVPITLTPERRWFTTKAGHTLKQAEVLEGDIRHLDRCARCGAERDAGPRRHDGDRVDVGGPADEAEGEAEEEA
jgi:hypothetical protein